MNKTNTKNQQGLILPVSMLFLLIMTIVGVSSISSTSLGEKIATNYYDTHLAFNGAEAALRSGEEYLETSPSQPTECNTNACDVWEANSLADIFTVTDTWWTTNGSSISGSLSHVYYQPVHVIEKLFFIPDDLSQDALSEGIGIHYYEVTGRGIGGSSNAEALVQSVYITRFN